MGIFLNTKEDDFVSMDSLLEENYVDIETPVLSFNEYAEYVRAITEAIDPDEGYGNALRPVFIVLTKGTGLVSKVGDKITKKVFGHAEDFWHSAIGFGPNLKHLYSFNVMKEGQSIGPIGGLSFESVGLYQGQYPDADFQVTCIFVGSERYKDFRQSIEYYFKHKQKTKYDWIGLFKAVNGKNIKGAAPTSMFCSTFVDHVLKAGGVDFTGMNSGNVTPDDLKLKDDQMKRFLVYSGKVKDFDPEEAVKKVDKWSKDVNNDYFKAKEKMDKEKKKDEKEDDKKSSTNESSLLRDTFNMKE